MSQSPSSVELDVSSLNPWPAPKCSPLASLKRPTVSDLAALACTTCARYGCVATVAHPLTAGAGSMSPRNTYERVSAWLPGQLMTLLRAKPSKDGDAELRD